MKIEYSHLTFTEKNIFRRSIKQYQIIRNDDGYRVVFYRCLAEISGEYLKKGSKVYMEGKIHTRK